MSKTEGATTFTGEQVKELIGEMNAANLAAIRMLVEEMRKPTPEQAAKLDDDRKKAERKLADRLNNARAEEQAKEMRKKYCPHGSVTAAGVLKHTWRAQVNADGYFRPMCEQCQTQLPKIKATQYQIQNGLDLHRYAGLDVKTLEKWAEESAAAAAKG